MVMRTYSIGPLHFTPHFVLGSNSKVNRLIPCFDWIIQIADVGLLKYTKKDKSTTNFEFSVKKYRQKERSFALCCLNINKFSRIFP